MNGKLHILQHTLGLDQWGKGRQFRNHFVTGPKTTDWPHCVALVAEGLMEQHASHALSGGNPWFSVTEAGKKYVAENSPAEPAKPKMSRSKQRYDRFLKYGDGFESFLSYCCWDAKPERSWNQPQGNQNARRRSA